MADNKQYITRNQEGGSVMISEDVIGDIVSNAIKEVEGVVELNVKPGADIAEIIGKKNWAKGMKVAIGEDNSLMIDCNISIGYNQSVVEISKAVQEAISSAVESMVGISVTAVNVNVCGIVRQ